MSRLKVMTFNIRGATFDDGDNSWPKRAPLNTAVIRNADPDLVGFQEYQMNNHRDYEAAFGNHFGSILGRVYNRTGRLMYNTIFWRNERFTLLDSGTQYLSETPDQWSLGWDAARVHTVTWAVLREILTGEAFVMLNTHLDHHGEQARRQSAKQITHLTQAQFSDIRTVLTGDFNSSSSIRDPGSVYETFRTAGFQDTFNEAAHSDNSHTFHRFQGRRFDPALHTEESLRIDWVLVRGDFRPLGAEIIREEAPPLMPSDHYPVLAEIEFIPSVG